MVPVCSSARVGGQQGAIPLQTKRDEANPTKPARQKLMNSSLRQIRRIAIAKANTLQRAHGYLPQLRPAFAEWAAGEIYVCKKTGTYRYRFGEHSKSVTSWDGLVRKVFSTPEAFAFAAMVLGAEQPAALDDHSASGAGELFPVVQAAA
jgi:hypothetical protein